ncbi:MAG: dihydropteroate synthase [Rhodothermales bacterium]
MPGIPHTDRPLIMGILNVTPDSFSDGGLFMDPDAAAARATEMVAEGADVIDIGGASSRPGGGVYGEGAPLLSGSQELSRILPVIERLASHHPDIRISVDTFRSNVAREALAAGAAMLNDITALRFDRAMAAVAAEFDVPICLMHSVGMPGTMPHASEVTVESVVAELSDARARALESGARDVWLDPGFGFGKRVDVNLALIARLPELVAVGSPVLVGVSRKSSVGAALRPSYPEDAPVPPPHDRLSGSLALTALAVIGGARMVRTHDVKETADFLRVFCRARQHLQSA